MSALPFASSSINLSAVPSLSFPPFPSCIPTLQPLCHLSISLDIFKSNSQLVIPTSQRGLRYSGRLSSGVSLALICENQTIDTDHPKLQSALPFPSNAPKGRASSRTTRTEDKNVRREGEGGANVHDQTSSSSAQTSWLLTRE